MSLPRAAVLLGLLLGAVFGIFNLIVTMWLPLLDDSPAALLMFYGPMFFMWGVSGYVATRRTGKLLHGVAAAAAVALVTFVIFDLAVILRVNLFLETIRYRADWQNLIARYEASGFTSLRAYVNYEYVLGSPFKILIGAAIGAVVGSIGGLIGMQAQRESRPV